MFNLNDLQNKREELEQALKSNDLKSKMSITSIPRMGCTWCENTCSGTCDNTCQGSCKGYCQGCGSK